MKGDVFFTQEVLFQDKVQFGERAHETVPLGATGSSRARATDLGEAAVLGINSDFGVTPITLHWLCSVTAGGVIAPGGGFCDLGSQPAPSPDPQRCCQVCRLAPRRAALPCAPQPPFICLSH